MFTLAPFALTVKDWKLFICEAIFLFNDNLISSSLFSIIAPICLKSGD